MFFKHSLFMSFHTVFFIEVTWDRLQAMLGADPYLAGTPAWPLEPSCTYCSTPDVLKPLSEARGPEHRPRSSAYPHHVASLSRAAAVQLRIRLIAA